MSTMTPPVSGLEAGGFCTAGPDIIDPPPRREGEKAARGRM